MYFMGIFLQRNCTFDAHTEYLRIGKRLLGRVTYGIAMLPGPSGMRRRALPGSLLEVRLRQTLPPIIVLRRAALAVVGSHPSRVLSIYPIFSKIALCQNSPAVNSSSREFDLLANNRIHINAILFTIREFTFLLFSTFL